MIIYSIWIKWKVCVCMWFGKIFLCSIQIGILQSSNGSNKQHCDCLCCRRRWFYFNSLQNIFNVYRQWLEWRRFSLDMFDVPHNIWFGTLPATATKTHTVATTCIFIFPRFYCYCRDMTATKIKSADACKPANFMAVAASVDMIWSRKKQIAYYKWRQEDSAATEWMRECNVIRFIFIEE